MIQSNDFRDETQKTGEQGYLNIVGDKIEKLRQSVEEKEAEVQRLMDQ